jgi:7-cyano-7-deazaguanine synthase
MNKTVVLLSGGLDSTLCLFWAVAQHAKSGESFGKDGESPVVALAFDYGQTHDIEVVRSKRIAGWAEVPWEVLYLWEDIHSKLPVPEKPGAVMPARNAMFLSSAASWASSKFPDDSIRLVVGACQEDHKGFPDCRPAFFRAMQKVFAASELRVTISHPFVGLSKGEAVRQTFHDVQEHGWGEVDTLKHCLAMSWSCYDPKDHLPCGECAACRFRADGFREAGMEDPAKC